MESIASIVANEINANGGDADFVAEFGRGHVFAAITEGPETGRTDALPMEIGFFPGTHWNLYGL